MRQKPILAFVLAPMAMAWIGSWSARAQESGRGIPSSPPLVLEYEKAPSVPPRGARRNPAPSPQHFDFREIGGNAALGRLSNPFDGERPKNIVEPVPVRAPAGPLPSDQSPSSQLPGGREATNPLPNSYNANPMEPQRGLFGWLKQQRVRVAEPSPPPGGMPTTTAPGPVAGAGAAAVPGPAGAPAAASAAAPTPGAYPTATPETPSIPSAAVPGPAGAPAASAAAPTPGAYPTATPEAPSIPSAAVPIPSESTPSAADIFGEAGAGTGAGFGGTLAAGSTPFAMIGDISPISPLPGPPGPPTPPGARGASPIFSTARNFKISENQSPRPQDRVFFEFNYYNNVNDTINVRDLSPVTQMKAYIYNFGFEKTFNNGMGSIGIRLPLDNLTANSSGNVISTPTTSALGNLTVFSKYILAQNRQTGSLISASWAITPQTGTSRFAGAPYLFPLNSTYFQASIGYIYNYNKWYFQGFSGFSFPINPNDVTLIYNDVAVGYYLLRNPDSRTGLTALAPTVELHVNNPLDHRDPFNRLDLAGTPDSVDLTFGLNFGLRNSAVLTAAFSMPVTSPKPFDSEAILMLNVYFGRTRRLIPITPPSL
jgi:hypothetical protein